MGSRVHPPKSEKDIAKSVKDVVLKKLVDVSEKIYQIQLSRLQLLKPGLNLPTCWTPITLQQQSTCFKVVAASKGGHLLSIFDGVTEYNLGHWTVSRRGAHGWPPLNACYYVHPTPQDAVAAEFPAGSKLLDSPRVLVQVAVKGRGYKHDSNMWAFERIKVLNLVSQSTRGGPYAIAAKYVKN